MFTAKQWLLKTSGTDNFQEVHDIFFIVLIEQSSVYFRILKGNLSVVAYKTFCSLKVITVKD